MRVLVVSAPVTSHLLPLLPLADALWEAGHDVLVATGGDALDADSGEVAVIDVARGVRLGRIAARCLATHPLAAPGWFSGRDMRMPTRLFGALNEELADPLVTVVEQWRPDAVVFEAFAVAGALAAARHDVPAILVECTLQDGREFARAIVAQPLMQRALRRHGLDEDGLPAPAFTLTTAPPSLVGPRPGLPMRPVQRAGGEIPAWLRVPSDEADLPRILVSRSTLRGSRPDPLSAAVRAAADVDAEIVLVRPELRVARRAARARGRIRTVGWVPLPDVMPFCAAVVHHGGAGTALGALAAGIPQLAVPGLGDRRFTAEAVAARGAGLAGPVTAEALTRLVTDGELAANAREVRAEIEAMPSPGERVADVAALA